MSCSNSSTNKADKKTAGSGPPNSGSPDSSPPALPNSGSPVARASIFRRILWRTRRFDASIVEFMGKIQHPAAVFLCRALYVTFSFWGVFVLYLLNLMFNIGTSFYFLVLFGLNTAITFALKYSVKRRRPLLSLKKKRLMFYDPFSFPSGHSSAVMSIALLIAWQFPDLRIPAASVALLVGASRIYIREHYLFDVLFGYIVGAASFVALRFIEDTMLFTLLMSHYHSFFTRLFSRVIHLM